MYMADVEELGTASLWREVVGWPAYMVSDDGCVMNKRSGRVLKPGMSRGYPSVFLYRHGEQKTIKVHRLVALHHVANPNPELKTCVDHIDGNSANNRAANLRWASRAENGMNMARRRDNTSGFVGVTRHSGKWQAIVRVNGKNKTIGTFATPDEAALARDAVARVHHGEFAVFNYPMPGEASIRTTHCPQHPTAALALYTL